VANPRLKSERGSTLLEVLMASLILTIALLAVASTLGQGIFAMFLAQEELIAKQKAREALESVFTARNTQNILFDQIRNAADTGIFVDGYAAIRGVGGDGIANTADDSAQAIEQVVLAGRDGTVGTGDDETRTLTSFQRRITISNVLLQNGNVDPDIRRITVEVRFQVRGIWRTVRVASEISRFS
jgi:type II secretory pathway pseudopilin PulG